MGATETWSFFQTSWCLWAVCAVYREGVSIVLELNDGVFPAEVVRRVLDLGHGLAMPHFVFAAKPNQDERTVVKRLMESPYVVTAAYYPQAAASWWRCRAPQRRRWRRF
jgi:hypothetical protein